MPPTRTAAFSPLVSPKTWNSGSAPNVTVSGPESTRSTEICAAARRLPWVSSAPFGVPVVPDV